MPTFGYSDETNSAGYVTIPFIDTIFTQIEKWAPIFKSKLSNWILTKEQRKISTESTPIFIPLVVALFAYNFFGYALDVLFHPRLEAYKSIWKFLTISDEIFATLVIGLPLEVVHGPLVTSIFYLGSAIYGFTFSYILDGEMMQELYCHGATYALIALNLTNILKNWKIFENKYLHFLIIAIYIIPQETEDIKDRIQGEIHFQNFHILHAIGGCLYGFQLGYFWIYKNVNGEPLEKISRRHLSITIGVLTAYALLAKVSGIYTHPYYA